MRDSCSLIAEPTINQNAQVTLGLLGSLHRCAVTPTMPERTPALDKKAGILHSLDNELLSRTGVAHRSQFNVMNEMRGNPDRLHHAPDSSAAALLLIDVINDLEFDGAEDLLPSAMQMAAALSVFKRRAKEQGIPVIYVNDNFGRWRSDFPKLVEYCSREEARGREIVIRLKPEDDDYFVLKPKHSAFFQTNLEMLLDYLGASTVILTGMAADICVLFSANDAYMRDFQIYIPPDCVASESDERTRSALLLMQRVLKADISPSTNLELENLIAAGKANKPQPASE